MDPVTNLREQREAAAAVLHLSDEGSVHSVGDLITQAERLAEHVQALDEWRLKGGFDPYNPLRPS